MLRRTPTKSPFQLRLEKAFPWMVFTILGIGAFIYALQTVWFRTEERLIEKQACRDGVADISVDCSIYFGPRWTDEVIVEPVASGAP